MYNHVWVSIEFLNKIFRCNLVLSLLPLSRSDHDITHQLFKQHGVFHLDVFIYLYAMFILTGKSHLAIKCFIMQAC